MSFAAGWRVVGAILSLLAVLAAAPSNASPVSTDELRSFIADRVARVGAPGAAFVLVDERDIFSDAVGLHARYPASPLSADTPMALGSISKLFTALAVMQLVERDEVELDAPVSRYLPWLRLGAAGDAAARITVRQLLSHSSGLSTLDGNRSHDDLSTTPGALRRRVERLADVAPAQPGTWRYSNANYQILGALIEQVSGQPYADYISANIFKPLGMARSFILSPPAGVTPAQGHRFWFGSTRPVEGPVLGAGSAPQGGVYASATDLGRFLRAVIARDPSLLGAATWAEMLQPQPDLPRQALGWRVGAPGAPQLRWHAGQTPGFDALLSFDPARKRGFAILVNASPSLVFGPAQSITFGATSQVFGAADVPPDPSAFELILVGGLAAASVICVAATLWLWRRRFAARRGRRWSIVLRGIGAVLLLAAAVLVIRVPELLFGAPLGAAWLFMPDAAVLLVSAAIGLLLVGVTLAWTLVSAARARPSPG